jgi:small subunit ribosomal protein S8
MVGDKVSNLIIGLKNAYGAKHSTFEFPYTKMSQSILEVLRKEGFIKDFEEKGKEAKDKKLEVSLKYEDGAPAISNVERTSKQSRRVYLGYKDIRPVKQGYGVSVISTPEGIMTGKEAKDKKLGGEELFKIW